MKSKNLFILVGFLIILILNSCDSIFNIEQNNSDLSIEFSDGNILKESDIEFYDSSTHTFFLKSDLKFKAPIRNFKIKVDGDSIIGGQLHSCVLSSFPPTPYSISDCFFSGRNILEIAYYGSGENILNGSKIQESLIENKKFRHGLSFQINSVKVVKLNSQTDVITKITIKNNDNIAYYIPDVNKMGERYYTDYTGGLSFSNINKGPSSFIKNSNSDRQRDEIKISDLSKLAANSEVSYTYTSRNYHEIPVGTYRVSARFMGIVYTASDFELNQNNGRIWVGEINSYKSVVVVE
jgi:hypothetical protein